MKKIFLLLPLLASCSEQAVTHLPIVAVRQPVEPATALTATIPVAPTSLAVTMDSLPAQVRAGNPSLAAARLLVAEAQGKLKSSGLRDNPELEVEFETTPRFHEFMLTVGISKKYPRTNRLFAEKRVSEILISAARAEVRDAERLLIGQARNALVQALAIRQQKSLIQAQQENATRLTELTEQAAVKGEGSPLDAGLALLEATRLENLVSQLAIKEVLAIARLKPLLGMKPEGKLTLAGSLSVPKMPALNVTTYRRPDLEAARLRARSAGAATDLAATRKLDDIEAGVFAGLGRDRDKPGGFEAEQIFGIRFKIPLGENPSTIGKVAEAHARQQRLALGALALERVVNSESHAAYAEMKQWLALSEQIKSRLLPLADTQIEKTEQARVQGQASLREVLLAKEQKLSLETSYLEAVRDFHLAYAAYLTATAQ